MFARIKKWFGKLFTRPTKNAAVVKQQETPETAEIKSSMVDRYMRSIRTTLDDQVNEPR